MLLPKTPLARGQALGDAHAPHPDFSFGRSTTLGEMLNDYVFFTPAILYVHCFFDDSILGDFQQLQSGDIRLWKLEFSDDILGDLGEEGFDKPWRRRLWVTRREDWIRVRDFFLTCTLTHFRWKAPRRVGFDTFVVKDPLGQLRQKPEALLPIGVFVAAGTQKEITLDPITLNCVAKNVGEPELPALVRQFSEIDRARVDAAAGSLGLLGLGGTASAPADTELGQPVP